MTILLIPVISRCILTIYGAHDRNRTGDLILTKDVLCRLSYMGLEYGSNRSSRLIFKPLKA
jgi:hypothetical protein